MISGKRSGGSQRLTGDSGKAATLFVLTAALALAWCLPAAAVVTRLQPLRTITTAKQAHDLSASEAVRGYPIHLRAVVTYYDPAVDPRHIAVFVHDQSGGIFLGLHVAPDGIGVGAVLDIRGVSGMGDFAPLIAQPRVVVVGKAKLPPTGPAVSLTRLLTGAEDGQWVEVEGVVRSIYEAPRDVGLQLAMRDGLITATLPLDPSSDYRHLVDARVIIHANAAPVFNGDKQMVGARLLVPNISSVQIIEPGLADPFDTPLRDIDTLSRFSSMSPLPRRIHVRGRVTLIYPGSLVCIRDVAHGICAHTKQATALAVGEMADVVGFVETGRAAPALVDALYRRDIAGGPVNISPVPVSPAQALYGNHDSELVRMDGQLIGRDLAASDTTLMLASDGFVFSVVLPLNLSGSASAAWQNGSRLRIKGVCSVLIDTQRSSMEGGAAIRQSFRILLRSPEDVVVLEQPSWWTPRHTLVVLAIALAGTLTILAWVVVLTRRLKLQTRVIRQSEEQFRHMAQHDALTGLPTRLLLHDRLDAALERSKRSGTGLGLLMLDLDNFKHINDSVGHHAGDQALKISAHRLTQSVRGSDTVARISGDEFVVLLADLNDPSEAELVAAKVVAALCAPFRVGDRDLPISASVGVCTTFGGVADAGALLKSVDIAMYHAKSEGRNRFQIYTPAMAIASTEHQKLRAELERALTRKEFEIVYQPLVSFANGELDGFEALLRWRSNELGLVMPGDFISLAEETGLIIPIGEWVLRQACREIAVLEQELGRSLVLAVNLSPRQMQHAGLTAAVSSVLEDAGRPPRQLELEITESLLMSDSSAVQATLESLRAFGVRLAIDDFGVGFSSLSYITRFSIDRIKIDRSFIRKCMREERSLAVVRAVVAMAHGLSMTVVAEGIETAAEFRFLRDEGCDTAQGYYLSRPVPANDLLSLVNDLDELVQVRLASPVT